ncbi:hypothetical protein C2E23DRAFT_725559, partial [Lenzites betulinus]
RPDYALNANGGKIFPTLTSPASEGSRQHIVPHNAYTETELVISEDMAIGRCWAAPIKSQIGLSTGTLIYPTHVTIEHIPRQIAIDIERAPRHVVVWGVVDGLSNMRRFKRFLYTHGTQAAPLLRGRTMPPISSTHTFMPLAAFEYNIWGNSPTQTFPVFDSIATSQMDFGIFVVEVIDNWGGTDICLYRVQVHGKPAALDVRGEM